MNGIYNKAEHVQILKPRSNGIILQYLVIRSDQHFSKKSVSAPHRTSQFFEKNSPHRTSPHIIIFLPHPHCTRTPPHIIIPLQNMNLEEV